MTRVQQACLCAIVFAAGCTAVAGLSDLTFDGSGGSATIATGPGGDGTGAAGGAGAMGGGGSTLTLAFSDTGEADFSAGEHDSTMWAGEGVTLNASASGQFTSRVFDAGGDVRWTTLTWTPAAPYGKPLVDNAAGENTYARGAVSMTQNVLLLHFEGPSGPHNAGSLLADSSGQGLDAVTTEVNALVPGIFGMAFDDLTDTGRAEIAIDGASSPLNFDDDSFTWATWFRMTQSCPGGSANRPFMQADDASNQPDADDTHMWIGCISGTSDNCANDTDSFGGGTFRATSGEAVIACGTSVLNDGQWHHLALSKGGHANATIRVYFDGVEQSSFPGVYTGAFTFNPTTFYIGGTPNRGPTASFDEMAIWKRRLEDEEIAALWQRGVMRMSFGVRVCERADCADDPAFEGSFVDPANTLSPPATHPLSLSRGRYFQYRASFESDASSETPELRSVTVEALP